MSLQFFNPWIGRMNRQQFLAGAFICGGMMYLGTLFIPELALVIILNIFWGFMIFVFVFRRLADKRVEGDPNMLDSIGQRYPLLDPQDPARLLRSLRNAQFLALFTAANSTVLTILLVIIALPLAMVAKKLAVPIQIGLALCIAGMLMARGNPQPNQYGYPPIGMDFRTTLPATYSAALAEQFEVIEQEQHEARERDLREQLERVKATRKAKIGGASPYIEFKGRG